MKNTKKILVLALAALLLVAVSVGGTIAYLQDATQPVTNVFTTSHVDIDLTETKTDFKMVPGTSIEKDPKVTVKANSEACWLFVKVEESDNLDQYIEYTIAAGWKELKAGVYYIEQPATASDVSYYVLDGNFVTVKDGLGNNEMTTAETNQPTLTFTAYAVQKEAAANATDAWAIAEKLEYSADAYPVPNSGT